MRDRIRVVRWRHRWAGSGKSFPWGPFVGWAGAAGAAFEASGEGGFELAFGAGRSGANARPIKAANSGNQLCDVAWSRAHTTARFIFPEVGEDGRPNLAEAMERHGAPSHILAQLAPLPPGEVCGRCTECPLGPHGPPERFFCATRRDGRPGSGLSDVRGWVGRRLSGAGQGILRARPWERFDSKPNLGRSGSRRPASSMVAGPQ
jgi:hypothetical protein